MLPEQIKFAQPGRPSFIAGGIELAPLAERA
jgi:hypothetical protein